MQLRVTCHVGVKLNCEAAHDFDYGEDHADISEYDEKSSNTNFTTL